jgi:hypothetical protein
MPAGMVEVRPQGQVRRHVGDRPDHGTGLQRRRRTLEEQHEAQGAGVLHCRRPQRIQRFAGGGQGRAHGGQQRRARDDEVGIGWQLAWAMAPAAARMTVSTVPSRGARPARTGRPRRQRRGRGPGLPGRAAPPCQAGGESLEELREDRAGIAAGTVEGRIGCRHQQLARMGRGRGRRCARRWPPGSASGSCRCRRRPPGRR